MKGGAMAYDIPESLETSRLKLRRCELRDWQPLCAIFSDPECVRYTVKTPLPDWQTWRWLAAFAGHWDLRGYGPYAVEEKSTGTTMGVVGLWYPGDWPEPELTYSIARPFWGKGYVTEAGQVAKDLATQRLGWTRLISLISPENVRSKAVAQRLGGKFEKNIPFRDATADMFAYTLSSP
jgi:RimJ/RimL family protein N-acetyltransferase